MEYPKEPSMERLENLKIPIKERSSIIWKCCTFKASELTAIFTCENMRTVLKKRDTSAIIYMCNNATSILKAICKGTLYKNDY